MEHWDLVIVGAGPAGLTAGIYGVRSGLRTLILEAKFAGGLAAEAPIIENYPGFPEPIRGGDLIRRFVEHCRRVGVEVREWEEAVRLKLDGEVKVVETVSDSYASKAVIIATGCTHRKLGVPGEEEFLGRGVSYCTICDAPLFKGKEVLVVGGGNSAVISAIHLSSLASRVVLIHRRGRLRAEEGLVKDMMKLGVEFLPNTELKRIEGDSTVRFVELFNNKTGESFKMGVDGVFVQVGEVPNSELARRAGVKLDSRGYIIVDSRQRTNIPGVYAAGDVTTCPVKQVGTAVGQGIIAAVEAYGYIRRPYYYKP